MSANVMGTNRELSAGADSFDARKIASILILLAWERRHERHHLARPQLLILSLGTGVHSPSTLTS